MVNFKIPAFLLASASFSMAAALPHDNLAPRGIASPGFDEKSLIARDEIAVAKPVHGLEARQIATGGQIQLVAAIWAFANASVPFVNAIQTVCANQNATTSEVAAVTVANMNALIALLNPVLFTSKIFAASKLQLSMTATTQAALTGLVSPLVKCGKALYSRPDLVAVTKLTVTSATTWTSLWVQLATALKTIIPTPTGILVSSAASLGFTGTIASAVGWQKLQGYYC